MNFGESNHHSHPIDGTLDLHVFHPRDVKSLVPEYLEACRERGITQIRIIHGKGQGTLRSIVHAILASDPSVAGYRHEGSSGGSWGATVVNLRPLSEPGTPQSAPNPAGGSNMPDVEQVRTALEEMHGLIHEAMSNVELDSTQGHALIGLIQSFIGSLTSGALSNDGLRRLLAEVGAGVSGPATREREKDNPIAAVHRVEEIIRELRG
jgi:hypothetical protein